MGLYRFVETASVMTFTLAVFLNLLIQRRRGIRAIALSSSDRLESLGVLALGGWFLAVYLHGIGVVSWAFGPRLFESVLLEGVASILCVLGLAIGLSAYVTMGRSWRIGVDRTADEALVTDGVFAFSRNPIYLFVDLFAIAAVLGTGRVFFLVTAPIILVGVHRQIVREESFLSDHYGLRFEVYRARVARYFGPLRTSSPLE